MKLLEKREIASAKSKEQFQLVQEGLKLARRIDSLRETLSSEEQSLEKFREHSVGVINSQIKEKESILNALLKEVRSLRDERERLLVPLDEEWSKVNTLRASIDLERRVLGDRLEETRLLTDNLVRNRTKLDALLKRAEMDSERAKSLVHEREDAWRLAAEFMKKAEKTTARASDILSRAVEKEEQFDLKLGESTRRFSDWERKLTEREEKIEKAFKKLKDRKEALQRSIKRYGKPSRIIQ